MTTQSTDDLVKLDAELRCGPARDDIELARDAMDKSADAIERLQRGLAARDKTIETLREDAERMDWLEAERTDVPGTLFRSNNRITRAAIDAARSEVGKP